MQSSKDDANRCSMTKAVLLRSNPITRTKWDVLTTQHALSIFSSLNEIEPLSNELQDPFVARETHSIDKCSNAKLAVKKGFGLIIVKGPESIHPRYASIHVHLRFLSRLCEKKWTPLRAAPLDRPLHCHVTGFIVSCSKAVNRQLFGDAALLFVDAELWLPAPRGRQPKLDAASVVHRPECSGALRQSTV